MPTQIIVVDSDEDTVFGVPCDLEEGEHDDLEEVEVPPGTYTVIRTDMVKDMADIDGVPTEVYLVKQIIMLEGQYLSVEVAGFI